MGEYLARDLGMPRLGLLDHRTFDAARQYVNERGENYFYAAQRDIGKAIEQLYGSQDQTLQRLAATFRRGDLIDELGGVPLESPDDVLAA
jgi:hypothetical protein